MADLMERHIAAQRAVAHAVHFANFSGAAEEVPCVSYANRSLGAAREDDTARAAIVNYEPRDDREARLKLTYIAAYLMATRASLNAHERNATLHTVGRTN
ncbi:hypothetical protein [Ensifer adhaerens]|uniref:Uncharacterized protein n=1 Tax=Ensifer adhaerens TaxID=106592 RepID=A0A9Q8YGV1_ENSAD|nr:hypothetical protein [Ensifer adhaerens]USJ28633.1 hypothetical protein NE863_35840 [Ensifer adhaerens]